MDKTLDQNAMLGRIQHGLDSWVIKDEAAGRYVVDREVFTDSDLFELEMRHIFEGNWIYVGHESQIQKPHDFLTTYIGRHPVILTRDREGDVGVFINACSHRGARVCREKAGNKKSFTCPFHGWVYGSNGNLLDVADEANGAYPDSFDRKALGLEPVGRMGIYRGFIFASLNPDVEELDNYLAGSKKFIDLLVDQSPDSELEVLRGATRYTYQGNWKLQAENGLDGYHVTSVHANYLMTAMRRQTGESANDTRVVDFSTWNQVNGGSFSFGNGHTLLWSDYANYKDRPNFAMVEDFERKFGAATAKWMNRRLRNLLLFPNVFVMDQTSTQLRIIRPIAVDQTEVMTYCIAPKGESATARALRIRQYEDFFNASGMATPDDLTEFNNCQIGFSAGSGRFNDMSRGAARWVKGVSEAGQEIGAQAHLSGTAIADEALYMALHEDWLERMKSAVAREMENVK